VFFMAALFSVTTSAQTCKAFEQVAQA